MVTPREDLQYQSQDHEALRNKEEELRKVQRIARVGSWYWDAQTDRVTVSEEVYELYGLDPAKPYPSLQEQKGTLLPVRSWERVSAAIARTVETGGPYELEFEVNHGNGGIVWIASRGEAIYNAQGEVVGLRGMVQDITARKQAEEALRESEERYAKLFEKSPIAAVLTKMPEGKFVGANDAFLKLFGFTREEVIGRKSVDLEISDADSQAQVASRLAELGAVSDFECKRVTKSGAELTVLLSLDWVSIGGVKYVLTSIVDITSRKRAEEALRLSEEKYRTLFNSIDEGFFQIDVLFNAEDRPVDLFYIEANAVATRIVGKDYTGKRLTELSPNYERYWFEIFGEVARTGVSVRLERYAEPDKKWYSFYVFKIGGPESRRIGNTFQDITERKRAEEALRRQAQLIDLTPDAIVVRAVDGTIEFWSKGAETLYGWTSKEAIGQKSHTLFKTRSSRPLEEIIKETLDTGRWSGELTHTTKDGRRVVVQSRWMVQCDGKGGVVGILESNLDISESKMAELALRESEGRFRTMADSTPVMIWVTNASGEIEFVNHAYEEFFGVTEAQAKSTGPWTMRVHPEDREHYADTFAKALELHKPFDAQARVMHRSGEWRWVHSYGLPRMSAHGEFLGHVGSSPDITEQKRAADALRASVENLRLMVSHASEAMMVIDGDGRIEAVSSLASHLLGYEEGELVGKAISQFAETFSRLEASLTLDNLRKGAPRPMTNSLRVRTKDGSKHWMSVTGHIVDLGMQGEKYFVKIQRIDLPAGRGSNPQENKGE